MSQSLAHAAAPQAARPAAMPSGVHAERVVGVEHHTDRLFSFRITRPASLRFRSGEFVMIGLPGGEHEEKPLFRAYSVASPAWDEELEFYSIKVPDGPLTGRLQKIKPGDTVLLRPRPTGTLVIDALLPGKRLFMLSTGTGLAPFASIVRDPEAYEKFGELILTHTARTRAELAYGERLAQTVADDPLIGEFSTGRFRIYQSTTREPSERTGRITTLIESGKLFADLGIAPFDPEHDRIMICGSVAMIRELKVLAERLGFAEGSLSRPGTFVVERAFVG
ncbi:MAG TPA: ferredoxin--NADP reductase [Mesorhizobium sp.]|nr:ferredoxin--NADP reductase [Mesorhizobium sp.]